MTNSTFPFFDMDMAKAMANFDPTKIFGQFTKAVSTLQFPQLDVDAITNTQRKNIEALNTANKAAVEGVQALTYRQNEILQGALVEAAEALNELAKATGPQEATVKQVELLKVSFETALGNIKELTELAAKSNADTSEAINARISEFLEEAKKHAVKTKRQGK